MTLGVTSSGIVTNLISKVKTAHSTFKQLLNVSYS